MSKKDVYCCAQVTDGNPLVPSVIRYCSTCGAKVWVDKQFVALAEGMIIRCMTCVVEQVEAATA